MQDHNNNITHLKNRFILTLTVCGLNYRKFADMHGVTRSYISQIMQGSLPVSPRIEKEIRNFISEHKSKVRKTMSESLVD